MRKPLFVRWETQCFFVKILFFGTSKTGAGKVFLWNFFKQNVDQLIKIYGKASSPLFRRCFQFSTCTQCSEAVAQDVEVQIYKLLVYYSGFELQKSIGVLCRAFRRAGKSEPKSKGSSFHGANSSEQTHTPNYSEATWWLFGFSQIKILCLSYKGENAFLSNFKNGNKD